MKGTIFILFEDFIVAELGDDAFDDILASVRLATAEPFVGPGSYPASDLVTMTQAAADRMGRHPDDLLRSFGRFAFPAMARSIPVLLEGLDTPQQFLEQLDTILDTEVRKLHQGAQPARFTVLAVAGDEMLLEYESPHGLFSLVSGLLDGVSDWYRTPIDHRLVSTQGSNGTYLITFGTTVQPMAPEPEATHG